jgi:hypothetical protein
MSCWLESHQSLRDEPKLHDLSHLMGWEYDLALGKLHRFWYWCVDYAEDGDLRRHNDDRIGRSVGLNGEDCGKFVKAMVKSGWIDREPYFRVHDWWDWTKNWWKAKYKRSPAKWEHIRECYYRPLDPCTGPPTQPTKPNLPDVGPDGPTSTPQPPIGGAGQDVPEGESPCKTFLADLAEKFENMEPRSNDQAKQDQFKTYCQQYGKTAGMILRYCLGDRAKAMQGVYAVGRRMESLGIKRWGLKTVRDHVLEWWNDQVGYEAETKQLKERGR